jgi:ABC-type branched-subunit amino acid transport system substrate-binding protein
MLPFDHIRSIACPGAAILAVALAGCGPGASPANDTPPPAVAAESPSAEARGKVIYTTGASAAGRPIVARVNDVPVPSGVVACVNCHGTDGRGRAEGGVVPSAITWDVLTNPPATAARRYPPYTDESLARAIAAGVDPARNRLNATMPRYEMAAEDLADLTAYLKVLGREPERGVDDDAVRIGVLLPPTHAEGVRQVLTAFAGRLNAGGGLYRRRVELRFAQPPAEPARRAWAIRALLEGEAVFACVAPPTAETAAAAALFEEFRTPLVGPAPPATDGPLNPFVFSLYPSAGEQPLALVAFAVERDPQAKHRAAVVTVAGTPADSPADAVARRCEQSGCPAEVVRGVPADAARRQALARRMAADGTDLLFHLAPARDLRPLLEAGAAVGWNPSVLAAGPGVGAELFEPPPGLAGKVFLALPGLPPDEMSEAAREYRSLTDGRPRTGGQTAAEVSALASARVLVEGLKRAGRGLTREQFVRSLEGLARYDTGLTPPLTFGPGRRVGARGAHVLELDLKAKTLARSGPWVDLDRPAGPR